MSVTPVNISIHALREEGDQTTKQESTRTMDFLSTPSVRRATTSGPRCGYGRQLISIHALREEGDGQSQSSGGSTQISIHALREEGDRYPV